MSEPSILFFDGVCGLCDRTVDLVLREDRNHIFLFSPLQGETFKSVAQQHPKSVGANSIIVLCKAQSGEKLFMRSDAALYILSKLPRFHWLARIGYLVPVPIRDLFYRVIASTRYRIWGKRESCRMPTQAERARFLP
jgi:predicted DCC family thiol-disulfide oxidoreductase YuxK